MSSGLVLKKSPLAPASFPDLPDIDGVKLATLSLGMYGERDDLLVAHFPDGAASAGVYTSSATASADVLWCRQALKESGGRCRVLVVNAGNSNAFTGAAGVAKNDATIAAASGLAKCPRNEISIAATGVIGEPMEADCVANGVNKAWSDLGRADFEDVARAFMTTDTFPKGSAATTGIDGETVQLCGIAKGSGMIAPNMATMLSYIFTDAAISPDVCQTLLAQMVETTFNAITVDGDTSTSDSLMLFATGAAGHDPIQTVDDPRLEGFKAAFHTVLKDLALQIVRDGEGATKLIEISVTGAQSDRSAKVIAASVANSPLVKTALAASDANWGRIVMAVGKAGEPINNDALSISFADVQVATGGQRAPDYSEDAASAACQGDEILTSIDVGVGTGKATVWTCDLTHGYIEINGAYRT